MKKLEVIAVIYIVILIQIVSATLTINPHCSIVSSANVNFSNGSEIFLPFDYAQTSISGSNLTIFMGSNAESFCDSINTDLASYASSRKIVFTPEFLVALQTSSCSDAFNTYFNNFKKSGKLTSSSGTAFCSWDRMKISYSNNPDGVYFDAYNITNISVEDGGTYSYSMRNLKLYGLSYIMKNPDTEFSGIVKLLAEAVHFNFLCGGYPNVASYFNAAKTEYNTKQKLAILDVNYTAGETLNAGAEVPGSWAFGWLVNFALGEMHVPIVQAINLSDNVYLCSLKELPGYSEESVSLNTSSQTTIDAKSDANASLDISVNSNATGKITIALYNENPATSSYNTSTDYQIVALNKYIVITANSSEINEHLSDATIKIYYTHLEINAAGLNEDYLRLGYYNSSANTWTIFDTPRGGVDKTAHYVWANTNHFSIWGVFEAEAITSPSSPSSESEGRRYIGKIASENASSPPAAENNQTNYSEEKQALFDINLKMLKDKYIFLQEQKISAKISLTNIGNPGKINAAIRYEIEDEAGEIVYQETEIVPVETQEELIKEIDISNLQPGKYTLIAILRYEGQIEPARADDAFEIKESFFVKFKLEIYLVIAVLLIGLVILVVKHGIKLKEHIHLKRFAKKVHVHFTPVHKRKH